MRRRGQRVRHVAPTVPAFTKRRRTTRRRGPTKSFCLDLAPVQKPGDQRLGLDPYRGCISPQPSASQVFLGARSNSRIEDRAPYRRVGGMERVQGRLPTGESNAAGRDDDGLRCGVLTFT